MYDDVDVGYKLEIVILVAKPQFTENISQDHDSMFTVASMSSRCKTSVHHSQCIYTLPGWKWYRACSNICYKRVNILWHF